MTNEAKWTQEPWPAFRMEDCVTATPDPDSAGVMLISPEDYIRARACVNACAGMIGSLEGLDIAQTIQKSMDQTDEAVSLATQYKQQRDALAEALRRILDGIPPVGQDGQMYVDHHRAGEYLGTEHVDPLAVIQSIAGVAIAALASLQS